MTMEEAATDPTNLHIYEFADTDWVVASSPEDAWKVWLEQIGGTRTDYDADEEPELVPDDKAISFWCDAAGKITEIGDGAVVKRTAKEWAEREGRCFLGSRDN